jgi:predicted transcriptional regulator YheO
MHDRRIDTISNWEMLDQAKEYFTTLSRIILRSISIFVWEMLDQAKEYFTTLSRIILRSISIFVLVERQAAHCIIMLCTNVNLIA